MLIIFFTGKILKLNSMNLAAVAGTKKCKSSLYRETDPFIGFNHDSSGSVLQRPSDEVMDTHKSSRHWTFNQALALLHVLRTSSLTVFIQF